MSHEKAPSGHGDGLNGPAGHLDPSEGDNARVAAYAEILADFHHGGIIHWDELSDELQAVFRREAHAVIAVADLEMAALVKDRQQAIAERDEARAEVSWLAEQMRAETGSGGWVETARRAALSEQGPTGERA